MPVIYGIIIAAILALQDLAALPLHALRACIIESRRKMPLQASIFTCGIIKISVFMGRLRRVEEAHKSGRLPETAKTGFQPPPGGRCHRAWRGLTLRGRPCASMTFDERRGEKNAEY